MGSWNSTDPLAAGREKVTLAVRVFGMDRAGRPFSQSAHTIEIGGSSVRISGLNVALTQGDVIGLQHSDRKGRFRVALIGHSGTGQAGQFELEAVEVPQNFWEKAPTGIVKEKDEGRDRRQHTRHAIAGVAMVRTAGSAASYQTALADLSFGGCYLQTLVPLAIGTAVTIQVKIDDKSFGVAGVVRTCHPNMGMGVEFTGESNRGLQDFVQQLEQGGKKPQANETVPKADARYTASRMRSVTNELHDVAQLIQCTDVEPNILRQFRDVLGHVRNTAWALERYMDSQAGNASAVAQLSFLTAERIRLATQLCKALSEEVTEVPVDARQLHELAETVAEIVAAESKARTTRKRS
jgi:hypothetical protein